VKKLIIISTVLLLLFSNQSCTLAQAAFSYDILISDIESQVKKGNKRALRDLGSLLDKPVYHDQAVLLLESNTFFLKSEIDIQHASREQFMKFFFSFEEKIKYSEILKAFYVTPVELQPYSFKIIMGASTEEEDPTNVLRLYVLEFEKALKNSADYPTLQAQIVKIAQLNIRESFQWLRNTLNSAPFPKEATELYLALCEGLKNEPSDENLTIILNTVDKKLIGAELLSATLIELTNYAVTPLQTQQLKDSLETFEALRSYGYDQILPFKEVFFYDKVEYYAKILSRKDTPWIQHNALRDLLLTQNPRLLFYLAAQIKANPADGENLVKLIQKLTFTQFTLPHTEGGDLNGKLDFIDKYKNFVRYWANNSEEFEWEDTKHVFVNKAEIAQRTEVYEKLFRRLNSENDSVARESFRQLAQGDPVAIAEMTEKYRSLLRNYNRTLPDIRFGYLEQMSLLVSYCQKNHVTIQFNKNLDSLFNILENTRNPQMRFNFENQIIKKANVQDLTAIEFYGCLHSTDQETSFSIGRVLDFLYTKHWQSITSDDEKLRLFLKKSFLFKKIGVVGICNSYQNKIQNINDSLRIRIKEIASIEGDNDIINQINVVIGASDDKKQETTSNSMLDLFLNDPVSFANGEMRMLPAPKEKDYKRLVGKIQSETEKEVLRIVMDYMDLHPSLDAVPSLFSIIMDDRKFKTESNTEGVRISDRVVNLLENIYSHVLKVEDKRSVWRKMWFKDGKNYRQWDIQFFEEQVQFLTTSKTPSIDDILEVSKSKYFNVKHKSLIISSLKKLSPFSDIRVFKSKLPFKASEDLKAFDTLAISAKDLDDFIKIYEVENDSTMWGFINFKTKNFSVDDLGIFYNSLFKVDWFLKQVLNERISNYQKNLAIETLSNYLTNSELISEFEEQTTLRHVAELQNIGMSLSEKLESSFSLDISDDAKASIQEGILMRISYDQIGTVGEYFELLSKKPGYNPTNFLYKDFGIPLFNPDKETVTEFITHHRTMGQLDLYKFYLKKFGVDFTKDNDELDFNKIYNILKFEIVTPFTGGGYQRDYFTYGIIKVLELHFKNRLGFHEKLNENQAFYTYSSTKRAVKWMQYLEENDLVKPDPSVPSSFNRLFANQ
jgi:hypothetical protein